jgi:hypothetical protein
MKQFRPPGDIGAKRGPCRSAKAGTGLAPGCGLGREDEAMQSMAQQARQPLPVRHGAPMPRRPSPRRARRPRLIAGLLWLLRLLFVVPVGRRAREERLGALPERTLRDIGLQRAEVQAAAWGLVPLAAVMQPYPSPGPLCVCGRPGFRPVVVRLSQAA